ncbi:hypothetical protein [Cellulomonas hominis]
MSRALSAWSVSSLVCVLAACAGGEPAPRDTISATWSARIEAILAEEPSDFVRESLADYAVSDAEYRQARNLYLQCMQDRGFVVEEEADGTFTTVYQYNTQPTAEVDAAISGCQDGTLDPIEGLFLGMRENPRGLTQAESIRECFVDNGVPDGAELSIAEFETMVFEEDFRASTAAGRECFWDPFGTHNYSEQDIEELDRNRVTHVVEITPGESAGRDVEDD